MSTRILIVDDEPIIRRAVKRVLASPRLDILEAGCGNDAIALLQRDLASPTIRLLCLDWMMPSGSGRDVLSWIKKNGHPAGVLIMTAYGSSQISREIAGFKVRGIITKPFDDIAQVRSRVTGCL